MNLPGNCTLSRSCKFHSFVKLDIKYITTSKIMIALIQDDWGHSNGPHNCSESFFREGQSMNVLKEVKF